MEQSRNGTTISYMTDEMADCQDTQDQRGYTKTNRRTQQTATPGFTEIFIVGLKMAKTTAASASADTPTSPDNHGWRLPVFSNGYSYLRGHGPQDVPHRRGEQDSSYIWASMCYTLIRYGEFERAHRVPRIYFCTVIQTE